LGEDGGIYALILHGVNGEPEQDFHFHYGENGNIAIYGMWQGGQGGTQRVWAYNAE
jgi:hypothetical protein